MSLGEKLRQARLEAGVSQRALCGDAITRNMLSQIENGVAQPSMQTLQYLAGQLGKPVSYFLGESPAAPPLSPLLQTVSTLEQTRQLLVAGKITQARAKLGQAETHSLPDWIARQAILLKAQLDPEGSNPLAATLPSLDGELQLRARAALEHKDIQRCISLLQATEKPDPLWHLTMAEALLLQENYPEAARHFHQAEEAYPHRTTQALEVCYRELEDYQKAYYYACKVRNLAGK